MGLSIVLQRLLPDCLLNLSKQISSKTVLKDLSSTTKASLLLFWSFGTVF